MSNNTYHNRKALHNQKLFSPTFPKGAFNDYVDTILPFLTTTHLYVDIFKPERGQK